jgi:hypothetical protein
VVQLSLSLIVLFAMKYVMMASSLRLGDARDAGGRRGVACRSVFDFAGLRGRGSEVALVGFEGDAQHLAADEVGDVDVLGCWGRHDV